jgi:hypothetical protein
MPGIPRRGGGTGEFLGSARWITTPHSSSATAEKFERAQRQDAAREIFARATEEQAEQAQGPDTELGALLDAIADEVHRISGAACEGIARDFAARAAYARRYLPRHMLAAALAAINEERKAALAAVRRNAAQELAARKKVAIEARKRPAAPKRPRKPRGPART